MQLNVSYIAFYGNDLWPDHPVKGFAFMEPFANKNPRTVRAILAALHESGIYCDKMENRPQVAKEVSVTEYLAAPVESILPSMLGHYDYGLGKKVDDPKHVLRFSIQNCTYPQPKEMTWFLTQFRRWGMIPSLQDYQKVSESVCRQDIYEDAMKFVGFKDYKRDDSPIKFFDGQVFDPASDPEKYATSFAVNSIKA